jgi:hypothetical protein
MIFSPYGIGPNTGDVPSILAADLLYRERFGEGLLQSPNQGSANGSPAAPVIPAPDATWDQYMRAGFRGSVPPDSPVDLPSNLSIAWHPTTWYRPFWPQMKAFSLPTFGDTGIRINLQGRERDGLVPLEDYSKACDEISAVLTACTDARTGRVAVDEITYVRETDPLAPNGQDADLLVSWVPGVAAIEHPTLGRVGPLPFKRTGAHNSQGFAFIDAPNIASGRRAATELTMMIEALLRSDTPADR